MKAGVFETLRVREGRIPFLAQHLARLEGAARRLGLALPPDLAARIERTALREIVVRVTLDPVGVVIETRAVPAPGAAVVVRAREPHRPYPFKSTERSVFDAARAGIIAGGATEALLVTREGWLAEGTITSVAFWRERVLCLPALELGILPGIGRERLIALAGRQGIDVDEGRYLEEDWLGQPMLLVNAVRGIIEVQTLDGVRLPVAPRTAQLVTRFWP